MAEKASWDPAYGGQKIGFDLENRKKISWTINDYFYLLVSLLFILRVFMLVTDQAVSPAY